MILIRHGESHFNVVFNETRVDPGIVAAGADHRHSRVNGQLGERPFQLTLHGALALLSLKAVEICAEIGHDQLHSMRHNGHPRTGRSETVIDL